MKNLTGQLKKAKMILNTFPKGSEEHNKWSQYVQWTKECIQNAK